MSAWIVGFVAAGIQLSADRDRLHPKRVRDPAEAITEHLLVRPGESTSADDRRRRPDQPRRSVAPGLDRANDPLGRHQGEARWRRGQLRGKADVAGRTTNQVLVEGICVYQPVEGTSVGDLSRERKTLQDEVYGVADVCLDDYRHRLLGL